MRQLIYIPVIHTQVDMGSMADALKESYLERHGEEKWASRVKAIDQMWEGIQRKIEELALDPKQVKLYQDGLPICGKEIEIVRIKPTLKTTCTGVEMFRKLLDQGQAGDNVGVLLRGTKREEVERGQVLAKPGSITPHTKFTAEIYVLGKDEGGRHTPFFQGYRPQFYFRTTDVTGAVELPAGTEMVMPGDNVSITVNLINPIAMEEGLRFAIREGGRTVGAGVVAKIIA